MIYCTGLGAVNPPVTAGQVAPSAVLSTTVNPVSVSIGGLDNKVLFAGLTPGYTGLYQVNVAVPQSTRIIQQLRSPYPRQGEPAPLCPSP